MIKQEREAERRGKVDKNGSNESKQMDIKTDKKVTGWKQMRETKKED